METSRIAWIDNYKGLLLVLTCSSHIGDKPWLIEQIMKPVPTYYVPLFIFLSGFLCKPNRPDLSVWGGQKVLIRKRVKCLLVSYLFFSMLALIHGCIMGHEISKMLHQMLWNGSSCGIATPMYFVGILFVVSIVFTWIIWYNNSSSSLPRLSVIIVTLTVLWLLTKEVDVDMPWHTKDLPFWGAFFLSGYALRLLLKDLSSQSSGPMKMGFFVTFILILIGIIGLRLPIKGTLLAVVCPISLMMGLFFLTNFSRLGRFVQKPNIFLQYVSVNGLVILGAHNFVNIYMGRFLRQFEVFNNHGWLFFVMSFIVISILLYFVVVPVMNTYLYSILGKPRRAWMDNFRKAI